MPPGMPLPLTTYVPLDYVPLGTFEGPESMPPMGEILDTVSVPPRYLEYKLTQESFAKSMKAQKKFERKLNAWSEKSKPFVDQIVAKALKTYENKHPRMDNIK